MTARVVNEGFIMTERLPISNLSSRRTAGPILLTQGIHDRLVRTEMSERIKFIHPNSELSLFTDSGHSPL